MSLEKELLAIEKNFWTGGPEAYAEHCDSQCLVVFVGMAKIMKRDEIAKTAEAGRWKDIKIKPVGLIELSDTSATIAYECKAVMKDGKPHHALVSSSYIRRKDGWKLATHQQTEVPEKTKA